LFTAALDLSDALFVFFFDIRTVYQKQQQSTMKTSSIFTFLAFIFLSFFVAPSLAGKGKGMNSSKGGGTQHPTPPTPQTCPETCQVIAAKPALFPCEFNGCIGRFECQNLPLAASGFKNQQDCIGYCALFVNDGCPSNKAFERCLDARCK
jgi:hypothetical protein